MRERKKSQNTINAMSQGRFYWSRSGVWGSCRFRPDPRSSFLIMILIKNKKPSLEVAGTERGGHNGALCSTNGEPHFGQTVMLQCWKFISCFGSDLKRETLLSDNKPLKGYVLILHQLRCCLESSLPLITDKKVAISFFLLDSKRLIFRKISSSGNLKLSFTPC